MIKMAVQVTGFDATLAKLLGINKKLERATERAIEELGTSTVQRFRAMILNDEVTPPKRRGKGPTLYKTGKYTRSFRYFKLGKHGLKFRFVGMNRNMSNHALADVLEYGTPGQPPRPHLRRLKEWLSTKGLDRLRRRLTYELGRS